MTNTTMSGVKPTFNSFMDYTKLDRNRQRTVVFYGRVSTEHEAQLSALENQMQWYSDQAKYHPNWNVIDKYIDEGITGTQAKKRPSFLRMIEDAKSGKFDLIVTREVCRFARNTVDTLNFTRELKNIGVEVYFVEDNIWTMDGDGELRLSLMATLAQEESRKVSERVKAGQKISRENKTLYGSGNILGYDRKPGETYTINPEQAETVKMIFELYAKGMGSSKICRMLTEAKRKNASGKVKWECSSVLHIIKNATYMGYICYNKSRSNNYLEQKRINNLDETTYELVEGDFPPIISETLWHECNRIRKAKSKPSVVVNGEVKAFSKRGANDFWQSKMKCKCGSSFRKDKWHQNKHKDVTYGYSCYNRIRHGDAKKREELGLDTDGFCDMKMICEWKMDLMAKTIFDNIWVDRQAMAGQVMELIRKHYTESVKEKGFVTLQYIQAQREKLESKKKNILNMRAENEINADEYAQLKKEMDAEFARLSEQEKNLTEQQELTTDFSENLQRIKKALQGLCDGTDKELTQDYIGGLVESVIPESNNKFVWNIRTGADKVTPFNTEVSGRKNKAIVKVDEFSEEGETPSLHKKSRIFGKLHRLHYAKVVKPEFALVWDFKITYEMAKNWRKAHNAYLRQNQWKDLTVRVCLDVG